MASDCDCFMDWSFSKWFWTFVSIDFVVLKRLCTIAISLFLFLILIVVTVESVLIDDKRLSLSADSLFIVSLSLNMMVLSWLISPAYSLMRTDILWLIFGHFILIVQFFMFCDVIITFLVNGCILSLNQFRWTVFLSEGMRIIIIFGVVLTDWF